MRSRACLPRLLLFALLLAPPFLAAPALAQGRVALVIGVGAYVNVPRLANPPNDAADLAASLQRLGFEVDLVRDPDRATLEQAVRRFGQRARGADVALFFYAGHALQLGERNWLLPRTADFEDERDLRFEALDLDSVLEQIANTARVSIVLLDACRDNPFRLRLANSGTRSAGPTGLAQVRAAVGTLVAFSTAPGTVAADGSGRNSPFTAALLRHIETPGLELRAMMATVRREVREATQGRQIPWEHSSMEGSFVFRAAVPAAAAPAPGPQPAAAVSGVQQAEILFWDSVRNSNQPAELRAYLDRYPDGTFAELARARLAQMERPPAPSRAAPQPAAAPVRPTAPPAPSTRSLTAAMLRQSVPLLTEERAQSIVERYGQGVLGHWALAASPASDAYVSVVAGLVTAEAAEETALERCQIATGVPCVPILVGDESRGRIGATAARDMPRLRYAGAFDPEQVPGMGPGPRQSSPVLRGYGTGRGARAMVLNARGGVFAFPAQTEKEAEERALAACNAAAELQGRGGDCFVYARGDQVVLGERRSTAR